MPQIPADEQVRLEPLRRALRTTMLTLAQDGELNQSEWTALLAAAVEAVPDAQAGSLYVRDERVFILTAQVGFSDALLGLVQPERVTQAWYGDPGAWTSGGARVIRGASVAAHSALVGEGEEDRRMYQEHGSVATLQATVCVPVVVEGQVAAQLNLDNMESEGAFDDRALDVAEDVAAQIAALLGARQRRMREAVRRRELEGLTQVNTALHQANSRDATEYVLVTHTAELLPGTHVIYLRYVPEGNVLKVTAASNVDAYLGVKFGRGSLVLTRILNSQGVQRFASASMIGQGPWMVAPLRTTRGELMGALMVCREQQQEFTPLEGSLLEAIISASATALEREQTLRAVEATREGAFLVLGLALEVRDFETSGHTERVVDLSTRLGQALGLLQGELEGLRQGAYLHDLGKLGVPDGVLLKPGKLTPDEWAIMKSHAEVGFEMTGHIPTLLPQARDVVRYHHERWDGTGYPLGLKGEEIPRCARLFSVVDVFDALTSERPYKAAWTVEAALAELVKQAGVQFDPVMVAAFVEMLD